MTVEDSNELVQPELPKQDSESSGTEYPNLVPCDQWEPEPSEVETIQVVAKPVKVQQPKKPASRAQPRRPPVRLVKLGKLASLEDVCNVFDQLSRDNTHRFYRLTNMTPLLKKRLSALLDIYQYVMTEENNRSVVIRRTRMNQAPERSKLQHLIQADRLERDAVQASRAYGPGKRTNSLVVMQSADELPKAENQPKRKGRGRRARQRQRQQQPKYKEDTLDQLVFNESDEADSNPSTSAYEFSDETNSNYDSSNSYGVKADVSTSSYVPSEEFNTWLERFLEDTRDSSAAIFPWSNISAGRAYESDEDRDSDKSDDWDEWSSDFNFDNFALAHADLGFYAFSYGGVED
jgi:hypothetical protein